jgi:hypothetical protein
VCTIVVRDNTNHVFGVAAIVYWREQGPQQFGRKPDSEDGGKWSYRGHLEDPLAFQKAWKLSMELLDQELDPCKGIQLRCMLHLNVHHIYLLVFALALEVFSPVPCLCGV